MEIGLPFYLHFANDLHLIKTSSHWEWASDLDKRIFQSKLVEEDFELIRESAVNSQTPNVLGGILPCVLPLIWFMYFLVFVVAGDVTGDITLYPFFLLIMKICSVLLTGLSLLIIIFSIKSVYRRLQKMQYLISIFATHFIFGLSPYLMALFRLGKSNNTTEALLMKITVVSLSSGIVIFIATWICIYVLLHNGQFRKETKRGFQRGSLLKFIVVIILMATVGFTVQMVLRIIASLELNEIIVIISGFILFTVMSCILSIQLFVLHCKIQFISFNYQSNGRFLIRSQDG
ncbi:hypothetical protein AV649_14530 [Rossellomorea marisflavi]|uniref:Uncharacterized protein n=1 Tax=Rossellomorea marisflavi TaxID=189381 RepID=A0A165L041_9BACI|nr:hypothetical protein AV649_14530 [Rossellomorea marisflavi]